MTFDSYNHKECAVGAGGITARIAIVAIVAIVLGCFSFFWIKETNRIITYGTILLEVVIALAWAVTVWTLREDEDSVWIMDLIFVSLLVLHALWFVSILNAGSSKTSFWFSVFVTIVVVIHLGFVVFVTFRELEEFFYKELRDSWITASKVIIISLVVYYIALAIYATYVKKSTQSAGFEPARVSPMYFKYIAIDHSATTADESLTQRVVFTHMWGSTDSCFHRSILFSKYSLGSYMCKKLAKS